VGISEKRRRVGSSIAENDITLRYIVALWTSAHCSRPYATSGVVETFSSLYSKHAVYVSD
jgi:hypothetical protein